MEEGDDKLFFVLNNLKVESVINCQKIEGVWLFVLIICLVMYCLKVVWIVFEIEIFNND